MDDQQGERPGGASGQPGERPRAGQLLVATPVLADPNFAASVVLLLDSDENGALGVVLNRPSPVPVAEVLSGWSDLAGPPGVLFQGGPVSTDSALAVATLSRADTPATTAGEPDDPVGWRRLFGDTGIVDLDTPTELVASAVRGLRIFAGYAGWDGQQILDEIAEGAWHVVPAEPADVVSTEPERLWSTVLRRQPGALAWLSTQPVDPTRN